MVSDVLRGSLKQACLIVVASTVAAAAAAGCSNYYEDVYVPLTDPALAAGGTGGTAGTGGAPPGCIPTQAGDQPIDASCGVFVAAAKGSDTNGGTKDKPLATLKKAVEVSKGKRIYACADAVKPFTEALAVSGEATIFGGLDCATWRYVPQSKTKWTAPADEVPLTAKISASMTL